MSQPVITPRQDWKPVEDNGNVTRPWYLYFQAITGAITEFINNAVYGKTALMHAGAIAKVTAVGTIGEAWFTESQTATLVRAAQADLASLAATLSTTQTGLMVEVTDFRHILQWTGTAWKWGPGEDGRHDIVGLPVDPDDTTGWQLCDGSTVAYLKGDGTTASYTTPDLVSAPAAAAYLKFGDPATGVNPAVAPSLTGGSIGSAATGITASTGSPVGLQINVNVTGATNVASSLHTHAVTITDPHHTHTLAGGSISDDGEPQNIVLRPWFRL